MLSKILTGHSFNGSIRYVHQDESRAIILAAEGVRDHNYKLMIKDFELQHQLRPSKKQACFHGILSFYPGENPGDKTMAEIAKKYLAEIGITNTQYVITKHTDKAHLHMHVIANMVDNNGNAIQDNWIGYRAKKAAQRLTQEYNLTPAIKKDLALIHVEALNESEANRYTIYAAIIEQLPSCRNMEELEARLRKLGIEMQYKFKSGTNEKQGVSFKLGEYCFKGSKIDRRFSLGNLERTLAIKQKQSPVHGHDDLSGTSEYKRLFISEGSSVQENHSHSKTPLPDQPKHDQLTSSESLVDVLMKSEKTDHQPGSNFGNEIVRRRRKKRSRRLRH